jgi:hypothetical protein
VLVAIVEKAVSAEIVVSVAVAVEVSPPEKGKTSVVVVEVSPPLGGETSIAFQFLN